MKNETVSQFQIGDVFWEIVKNTYKNEKKYRTEIKYHIYKNGKNVVLNGYTFGYEEDDARSLILAQYWVKPRSNNE